MVAYTKPQQRKKEESERLRGEEIRSSLLILDLKEVAIRLGNIKFDSTITRFGNGSKTKIMESAKGPNHFNS